MTRHESGRTAHFAAVLILFGCVAAFGATERAVAERRADVSAAEGALRADDAALRGLDAAEAQAAHLDAVREATAADANVARFLRDAARAVAARHARLVLVAAASSDARRDGATLRVTIDGRYADVVSAMRALCALTVPATLAVESLTRANPGAADPLVSATASLHLGVPEDPADAHVRPA